MAVGVEHIDGVLADALNDGAQPEVVEPQSFLRLPLLRYVANKAHHRRTGSGFDGLEHDVDGKFRAVFAQAEKIEIRAHLTRARCCAVVLAMPGMDAAKPHRHQHLDGLADQLLAL